MQVVGDWRPAKEALKAMGRAALFIFIGWWVGVGMTLWHYLNKEERKSK